jgi:hypothetical protein
MPIFQVIDWQSHRFEGFLRNPHGRTIILGRLCKDIVTFIVISIYGKLPQMQTRAVGAWCSL